MSGTRIVNGRIDTPTDLVFQNLMAAVVENARMAALEITDGVDTASMSTKLDAVRASVTRAAEVLDRLIRHADIRAEKEFKV